LLKKGIPFALGSAIMLGLTPIFGKLAILQGLDGIAVVALRTIGATILLSIILALFRRSYFYIFPLGLAGCLLAGTINGIGSLFFYAGLARVDASLGQFLYTLYPVWVAFLLYLDGQQPSKITIVRLGISVPGVYLLTQAETGFPNWQGVVFMCIASLLYALHIPINQRVLFEVPAPTVTLYTLDDGYRRSGLAASTPTRSFNPNWKYLAFDRAHPGYFPGSIVTFRRSEDDRRNPNLHLWLGGIIGDSHSRRQLAWRAPQFAPMGWRPSACINTAAISS
jgi:drug/metabolite transporter (DMT)-like permease